MEKSSKGKPLVKGPVDIFNKSALVSAILSKITPTSMGPGGAASISRGGFHTYNGYGSGHFKQNQRRQLARSRRRKMKTSARN